MGGEKVLWYKRRFEGTRCPLYDLVRKSSQQHGQDSLCQGTGYISDSLSVYNVTTSTLFTISNINSTTVTVSSTTGMHSGDTITQGDFSTTITSVVDGTHLILASTSGFTSVGFFQPVEIVASLLSGGPEQVIVEDFGRKRTYKPSCWTLWEPILTSGDFIVRRNGQRLLITECQQTRWKHYTLHQKFQVSEVERNSPIYQIPNGLA